MSRDPPGPRAYSVPTNTWRPFPAPSDGAGACASAVPFRPSGSARRRFRRHTAAYARSVYDEMYAKTYLHTVDTYEGIIPMLTSLHNDKGMKIAVFSNKQDPYVKGLCDQLFSKDIISYALGQTELPIKPDPSGVFRILDALEVTAEECVFVGDSEVDYHTAKNAGIDFIGVTWGYAGRDRLIACGSEHLADKAEEILEIIK